MGEKRIIVIGGGAAGLLAAGQAAQKGVAALILEKKLRPGRKLRITGKGRCNLTNNIPLEDFLEHFRAGNKFLRQAFNNFFTPDLLRFMKKIGVETVLERGGRIFPADNDAGMVVDALVKWSRDCSVSIRTSSRVESILTENGRVVGVQVKKESTGIKPLMASRLKSVRENAKLYRADAVIIATGGASYPATGSTGDGYRLAESLGHTVIPVRPSLVPLETAGDIAQRLQGLSLRNVSVRLYVDGKKKDELFGEMLFTHFGLSGPIILSLSRQVVDALDSKKQVILAIDLKPALEDGKLDERLRRDFKEHGKQKFQTILKGLLPQKMIPLCPELTGIDPDKTCNQLTADERKRLRRWLKDFRFEISGYRGFEEAIITAGGVSTKEIDPRSMQSRLVRGLFFAGEVMDIDADTGGYNLQAAFSTGWLAGQAAAEFVKKD